MADIQTVQERAQEDTREGVARRTFKYRLYPTAEQAVVLDRWLWLCRQLYNACLEQRIAAWKMQRKSLSKFTQMNELLDLKAAFPEFKEVNGQVLQNVVRRVDVSFQRFFKQGAGYPKFQDRRRYGSFAYSQNGWRFLGDTRRLRLTGCGEVRVRLSRPIQGVIKTVTIKRSRSGRWFVCFSCDAVPAKAYPETTAPVGIDLGLTTLVTTSDGEKLGDTRCLKRNLRKLRRVQRHIARQKRGSNRRRKSVRNLARLHERIADQRRDMHHKVSTALVQRYWLIAHESITPAFMLANPKMARAASDAGWSQLLRFLQWKSAEAGRDLVAVDPYNTSQACSTCGALVPKSLKQRTHSCRCGTVLDRDHNAALNILKLAQAGPSGANPAIARVA